MANTITLQCWVQGDDSDRVFPVEIEPTKTVGTLKEVIKDKKQHSFQNVDADALDLWNVSIPLDDSLDERLNNLELAGRGILRGFRKLSTVFSGKELDDYLTIVVKPPPGERALLRPSVIPPNHARPTQEPKF
jgi:hypothetical protein